RRRRSQRRRQLLSRERGGELAQMLLRQPLDQIAVHVHDTDSPLAGTSTGARRGTGLSCRVSTISKRPGFVRSDSLKAPYAASTTGVTISGRSSGTGIVSRQPPQKVRRTTGETTAPSAAWIASVTAICRAISASCRRWRQAASRSAAT